MSLCYLCLEVFNIILLVPIPRMYVKHQGKLYEPGTCTSKNSFSPLNFGSLAFREVESNRILLHISWSGLSKTPYSRMHWSRFDQFMIFASKGASVQRPGTTEPQMYYFDMDLLAKMPTFEDLEKFEKKPHFINQKLAFQADGNGKCGLPCTTAGTMLWHAFPDEFSLGDIGKKFFDYSALSDRTICFYIKEENQVSVYYAGPNDHGFGNFLADRLESWVPKWKIPIKVTGDFYVYQTSRNALCLLDSNRQLHYIAPIGGGAMVKKVSKLDYPVKIVYSGKTIDIFAANASYHLDERGGLSSPGKTVWPPPKK
jgi:hypothetical protein